MKDLTNDEIITMYESLDVLYGNIKQNKTYGFDLDVDSFFLRHRYAKTQIYGLRVQAYLCTLLKYKNTPSSDDCGDFKTREGEDVEFKCSFLDNYVRVFNIKQIRQWQDLNWYYVFTVDFSNYRNIIYKCYKLTKEQMNNECILMNAKPVHKTKKNNENDDKVELGFSIKEDSEHFKRWEEKYLNKKIDLKVLSDERLNEINEKQQLINEIERYKEELARLKANTQAVKEPEQKTVINEAIINSFSGESHVFTSTISKEERKEKFEEMVYEKPKAIFRDFMERYVVIEPDNSLSSEYKFTTGGSKYVSPEAREEEIQDRIKEFNKIPSEVFNHHLNCYLRNEISLDYLKSILNWEIKRLTKKRKTKEKPDNDISYYTKQFYDGLITQEELTEILSKKIIKWSNEDKIKRMADLDDDYFEYKPVEDDYSAIRRDSPVY